MKHGARPERPDKRDFSFRKSFGATPIKIDAIPDFNLHYGPIPNQEVPNATFNLPAYPYGCTDYSTCQVAANEDKVPYNPGFTESLTHANASGGGSVRDSIATSVNVGLLAQEEMPSQAAKHKRSAFFRVGQNPDFFTGFLTAMYLTNRCISIGTPYYTKWGEVGRDGIIATDFTEDPFALPWHNYLICGKKTTIDGTVYLIAETHQGDGYGDGGFSYYSRSDINKLMAIQGTCAFTVAQADPNAVQTVGHYFSKNLYLGIIDPDVGELQRALVFLGYSIPDAVTNVYGNETKSALALFQKANGIVDDGSHFGPRTRTVMNIALNPAQTAFGELLQRIQILFASFYSV